MVEGPNGEEIIWQDGAYNTPTIKLEDARLMAAAPDLLEALKNLLESHYNGNVIKADCAEAEAAIAKATGEKNGSKA
jgi:hypothetical protein